MRIWMTIIICLSCFSVLAQEPVRISENLEIIPVSGNAMIHVSYTNLENSEHFPANGFIFISGKDAIIVDTPWNDETAFQLIDWLTDSLALRIQGVIVTHWHADCMGGLQAFQDRGINSYALDLTCELAEAKGLPSPKLCIQDSLNLNISGKEVRIRYLGAGHTPDNIIVWFPHEKILFAGCLVKAMAWNSLGYTGDAVLEEWPHTLIRLLHEYPNCRIVIPGHGQPGGIELIQHTLELLDQ
jgi:metallo-beta-lactamase class B